MSTLSRCWQRRNFVKGRSKQQEVLLNVMDNMDSCYRPRSCSWGGSTFVISLPITTLWNVFPQKIYAWIRTFLISNYSAVQDIYIYTFLCSGPGHALLGGFGYTSLNCVSVKMSLDNTILRKLLLLLFQYCVYYGNCCVLSRGKIK